MKIEYKTIKHIIGNNDTVAAILRKYNHQNINKKHLSMLIDRFYQLNPNANPPKLGQKVTIPILLGFE